MAFHCFIYKCLKSSATAAKHVVVALLFVIGSWPVYSMDVPDEYPVLPVELLILQGDLRRLTTIENLPPQHQTGLRERIAGSLGLLPWLLFQAGDHNSVRVLQDIAAINKIHDSDRNEKHTHRLTWDTNSLTRVLDDLIDHHQLDLLPYQPERLSATQRREAKAIHETYCAGCHDEAGQGDPLLKLPARNLTLMAAEMETREFLARLISGIKGDASLLFKNPLTKQQTASLLWYYTRASKEK